MFFAISRRLAANEQNSHALPRTVSQDMGRKGVPPPHILLYINFTLNPSRVSSKKIIFLSWQKSFSKGQKSTHFRRCCPFLPEEWRWEPIGTEKPPPRKTNFVHVTGAAFCGGRFSLSQAQLRLKSVLDKAGAGYALLLSKIPLHAEVDGEGQILCRRHLNAQLPACRVAAEGRGREVVSIG